MDVRVLTPDDADWAAELMEARRQQYARYSPVFWRPAANVTGQHARFLRGLTSSADNVALRTENGFIISCRRQAEGFVDDFAVGSAGSWAQEGTALLIEAAARMARTGADAITAMRVVTAQADLPKVSMLEHAGLQLVERWWVRGVRPTAEPGPPRRVDGTGYSGIFSPAPPVYDPGGPVLAADRPAGDFDPEVMAGETAALGGVLAIVPAVPGSALDEALSRGPWTVSSAWYLGQPASKA
jgi:hypothetical protein